MSNERARAPAGGPFGARPRVPHKWGLHPPRLQFATEVNCPTPRAPSVPIEGSHFYRLRERFGLQTDPAPPAPPYNVPSQGSACSKWIRFGSTLGAFLDCKRRKKVSILTVPGSALGGLGLPGGADQGLKPKKPSTGREKVGLGSPRLGIIIYR